MDSLQKRYDEFEEYAILMKEGFKKHKNTTFGKEMEFLIGKENVIIPPLKLLTFEEKQKLDTKEY